MRTFSTTLFAFILLLVTPVLGRAQITIDGDLSESEYQTVPEEDNADGFQNSEIDELVYYADAANNFLYVGVKGTLTGGRGYGLWINVTGSGAPSGLSAGSELGIDASDDLHYINGDDGKNIAFTADFEVDYALALGAKAGGTVASAAQYTSGSLSAQRIDFVFDQSGEKASGTGPNGSTIEFAFDNSGGSSTGAELKIPFSELGASEKYDVELFSFLATNTGLFSNETIPGDGTQHSDDTEFNVKWHSNPGGPYHTAPHPLDNGEGDE
jgi:hypothetical protein